ncbi:pre-mRNA-splicing factor 38B isoform X2 [Phyllopteryx taeniolatus]|uniref:pre-mRNA-splicing factor 38B isoform X2 n=1 Tax=Phyllopteryx taeniolatus TaxID=161469 RepID=UPI002AD30406|nr:pre-mRNA-splicing factor 38B isoform X2 [Phyllopteryx taeniolatus]
MHAALCVSCFAVKKRCGGADEMEGGDKERRGQRGRDEDRDREDPAPSRPEGCDRYEPGLPIMHWEALSLRIAELEKQEEEKKDKLAKSASASLERGRAPVGCAGERAGGRHESREDGRRRHRYQRDRDDDEHEHEHVTALGSRESDDEEQEDDEEEEERDAGAAARRVGVVTGHETTAPADKSEKNKSRGFRNTWRKLRERLRADHKAASPTGSRPPVHAGRLERSDVRKLSPGELRARRSFLTQTVQELSSDLVAGLQVRDRLRTEQDAMLLELQDLTSPGSPLGIAIGTTRRVRPSSDGNDGRD